MIMSALLQNYNCLIFFLHAPIEDYKNALRDRKRKKHVDISSPIIMLTSMSAIVLQAIQACIRNPSAKITEISSLFEKMEMYHVGSQACVNYHHDSENMCRYFVPCVLSTKEAEPAVLQAAPLHLVFNPNNIPPGYIGHLVKVLSCTNNNILMMCTHGMSSNKVSFQCQVDKNYGKIDHVTVSGAHSSIRIDMCRKAHCAYNSSRANFPSTCQALLKLLCEAIHEVKQWFPDIEVQPAFQCRCSNKVPHFINISLEQQSTAHLSCEFLQVLPPSAEEQLWLRIPQSKVSWSVMSTLLHIALFACCSESESFI